MEEKGGKGVENGRKGGKGREWTNQVYRKWETMKGTDGEGGTKVGNEREGMKRCRK